MNQEQLYVPLMIAFAATAILILFSFIAEPVNVVELGEQAVRGTADVVEDVASVGTDLAEPVTTQVKAPSGFIENFDLNTSSIYVRNKSSFSVDITSVTVGGIQYDCNPVPVPPEELRILNPSLCKFLNFKEGDTVVVDGSANFKASGVV